MISKLQNKYEMLFPEAGKPMIVRSPGRVNIIGEHTDYNEGFVMPAAIDKAVYVAVGPRTDNEIHLYAVDYQQSHVVTVDSMAISDKHWPNYILGVADQIQKRGMQVKGFNLVIDGDVPLGAGLSSSAAVECAVAFALNELGGYKLDRRQLVDIAQKAEHTYAGVMCGIMDQFASMFGKKNHCIRLDCRSLDYEYEPLDLQGYKLLLLNTNVKHSLSSSEYNTRRQQCEQGVAWVKQHHAAVNSLRDVTMEMLNSYVLPKDELIYKRCKYVVEEIGRVIAAGNDLKAGNLKALGQKMYATHEGLSKEYEVSCKELDFLVDAVKGNAAVLGSRMMGGGFGGCTISIVEEAAIEPLVAKLSQEYKAGMGLELTAYVAQIENGTEVVTIEQPSHV